MPNPVRRAALFIPTTLLAIALAACGGDGGGSGGGASSGNGGSTGSNGTMSSSGGTGNGDWKCSGTSPCFCDQTGTLGYTEDSCPSDLPCCFVYSAGGSPEICACYNSTGATCDATRAGLNGTTKASCP